MGNIKNMEYLSLMDFIKILKSKILFIILLTVFCTSIMVIKVKYFTKPTYTAFTTVVIVKGDTSNVQNSKDSQYYTEGDITLYQKMAETYVKIAQSNLVINKTAEELKTYPSSQLQGMLKAATSGETQIIQLSAVSSSRDDVANMANIYCKNFINESMRILPVGKIEVLDPAITPTNPVSANKFKNIAVGFLFGLLLSIGIVFFRHYISTFKIKNEKEIINLLDIPVLVTIKK
ncbi:Wzz/FepE/Etk N-terminal domain-containing protein [Clostridium pasteurianum]|uniref:YveK family protein n=1 Tax=Clostridium pasteurianum TaxID=1501 RepID=UPI002260F7C5|nr:Wzz/FepE/Etk N-terminal domain-containing protein [Clostridium pasteurianum]UZW14935.1 Wzz/FepE/Etk N-terminal domain-containing protein [Clostridium pasteurianum]